MIFIFGRRKVRIKKYDDYHIKCDTCNSCGQRFSVYQEYFHLFFIPVFPSGIKTITSVCLQCNDSFNREKRNHYLSITRTPFYLYAGIILFVGLIVFLVIANLATQKQKEEYVAHPKVNDVYLIRQDEEKSTIYYFLKIKNIDVDTVELLHSNFQYKRFVSEMDDSDYFVRDDVFRVLKSDLKRDLDDGIINAVERDYKNSSRFSVEK